jgi:hypothetical protein
MPQFEDFFVGMLAGIAKSYNDHEFVWDLEPNLSGDPVTIAFPTSSPSYVVLRGYYKNGTKWWEVEYHNGLENGRYDAWRENGSQYLWAIHKDGVRIQERMI